MTGCEVCGGYELVDTDGDDVYDTPCPHCRSVTCPLHRETVAVRDGRLVGLCWECVQEAAQAEQRIRVGIRRAVVEAA